MMNWELFGDKEIIDATKAFTHISQFYHYSFLTEELILTALFKLCTSNNSPIKIKTSCVRIPKSNSFIDLSFDFVDKESEL